MTQTPERTTPPTPPGAIDQGKLEAFLGKVVDEVGAAYNTVLTPSATSSVSTGCSPRRGHCPRPSRRALRDR